MRRSGATRRAVLGAAALGWAAGWQAPARAAGVAAGAVASGAASGALADVLDRPAPAARNPAAAPLLRLARCGRRIVAVGERGIVVFSDDDGARWQQARVPVAVTLTGVQFTSAQRGFAIGHGGVVLRTDDAGASWQRLLDGRRPEIDAVDKPWLALHFSDDMNGLVVGAFGMALETADGGATWRSFADRIANPRSLHLHAVQRVGERVWVAGEQGLVAQSTDAGRRYAVLPTPSRGSFFALCVLADGSALVGGLRGTLLQHLGGEQFNTVPAASTQGVVQLLALPSPSPSPAAGLVLLDQGGQIFSAGPGELQFKALAALPARPRLAVVQAADGALVAASFDGVARLQSAFTKS